MRRRLAVLGILTMLLAPVVPSPAAAARPAAAPAAVTGRNAVEDTGKYYVVGPPVNGQQEFLFDIAAKTLRDGRRAQEIFELNEGRLQPDGETMTDPATVKPGWILVMPKDASGSGVRSGTPPVAGGAPGQKTPATSPSPGTTGTEDTTNAERPPSDRSDTLDFLQSTTALRVALVVLAVLLLVWAQLALSSRRRSMRPRPATASGANRAVTSPSSSGGTRTQVIGPVALPDERKRREGKAKRTDARTATAPQAAPKPDPWAAPQPASQPDPWAAPQATSQPDPWAAPAPALAPAQPAPPKLTPLPPARPQTASGQPTSAQPAPPQPAPAQPAPPQRAPLPAIAPAPVPPQPALEQPAAAAQTFAPSTPDPAPPAQSPPVPSAPAKTAPAGEPRPPAKPAKAVLEPFFENYDSPAETSFLSAIALPRPGGGMAELMSPTPPNPFAALVTDLVCGGVPATARLIGARPARWGSAHGWLADGEQLPPAGAPVVLGLHQGRRLWVDLTVAPDVLVLGGDPEAARAQGRDLAGQLAAAAEVTIVGDILGEAVPGCRHIGSVSELATDRPASGTRVVICDAGGAASLYARLRAIPASRGRTVPVVIGEGPGARWSVQLGNAVPSESGQVPVQSSAS